MPLFRSRKNARKHVDKAIERLDRRDRGKPDAATRGRRPLWPWALVFLVALGMLLLSGGALMAFLEWERRQGEAFTGDFAAGELLRPPSLREESVEDLPLSPGMLGGEAAEQGVEVYFLLPGGALAPQRLRLATDMAEEKTPLRLALENLLRGPVSASLLRPVPPGVQLRGAYRVGNEVVVDLSSSLAERPLGGIGAEWLCVQSIVHSALANSPQADSVRLLLEGRPATVLWSEISLSEPLLADPTVLPGAGS